jgi:polysaccharide export outer membrane protein
MLPSLTGMLEKRACMWVVATLLVVPALWVAGMTDARAATERVLEYVLGAGDVIRVTVFQNPDLTLETRVSENGSITYPLVGNVDVGGKTSELAERAISEKLKTGGFVKDPQVSVLVLQIRGNQVAVLGQVNRPGRYPLETANSRMSDILALAGGLASTGADTVIFTGVRDHRTIRREIDLASMFLDGRVADDIPLQGGDVLYVHRAPSFYIYGEVQRPGVYRLEREMNLMQALATGGGLTAKGTQHGVRVHRRSADGKQEVLEPRLDDPLQPDDVVYVKESFF